MQVITATVNQLLVLFLFMATGFFLNKKKIIPGDCSVVLSKLEAYIFVPCLVFNTFYKYCSVENFKQKWTFILVGSAIMSASVLIAKPLAHFFTKEKYIYKIYFYSFAVTNFSFMGNALVLGVFGEEILFDYMMFTLPITLYVYSFGTAAFKPESENTGFSIKMFLNPICISMLLGAVLGLIAIPLPKFLLNAISMGGATMSPVAMLLTGFIVGNYSLKLLASNKKVYVASVLRLVVIPALFMAALLLFKTERDILRVALCATAMPLGLNTIIFPAAYGGDTTPGASMALISHIIGAFTIPVMFAIFL